MTGGKCMNKNVPQPSMLEPMELQPWGFIPLFLHVVPTQEPECTTTSQACEGHDDELHAVLEGCDTKWQRVEDGLWLRSTPLPLLYDCFIESDDGNYRRFGEDDEDFVKILSDVGKSIAVALADSMTMRVFRPGQPVEILALKPGLRYLRCFPDLMGLLILGGRVSLLGAAWRKDNGKQPPTDVESQIMISIVRSRGSAHVSFW